MERDGYSPAFHPHTSPLRARFSFTVGASAVFHTYTTYSCTDTTTASVHIDTFQRVLPTPVGKRTARAG